jgi:hypothetical protein
MIRPPPGLSLPARGRFLAILALVFPPSGGATPLGAPCDYYTRCAESGQNTNDNSAVSVPGVIRSAVITSFQALQACANAGTWLPSSAEWRWRERVTPGCGCVTRCEPFEEAASYRQSSSASVRAGVPLRIIDAETP